jgi:GT2 family glycosyltransferase
MKLSVILVGNNQNDVLRQNLNSLIVAANGIDYEIIIVNDASMDGTEEMLASQFPQIKVIHNTYPEGVAKAYNKATEVSKGEYVLLVSADTLSGKETLKRVIDFMDIHQDAGGLGVRMLSPQGTFLTESNRGLTARWATFFKLVGFDKNLPKTRLNNRNHKAWVEEFQTTEVDILNGAFMLMRRSVLNEVGTFDERFVHYGFDIDMSYRIKLAGYKNYYFPKTYIINFKAAEAAKWTWNYIKYFYGAMFIFAAKYLFKHTRNKSTGYAAVVCADL